MDCREADVCVASSPEQIHTPDPRRYTTSSPTSVRPCGLYDRQPAAIQQQQQQQQQQLPAFSYTQPTPHRGVFPTYAAAAQAAGGAHVVSARRTRRTNSVPSAQRSVAPERYSTGRRWQERRNNTTNRSTNASHGDEETSYFAGRYMVDAMPSCATVCIAEASDEGAADGLYNAHYHYGCINYPTENHTVVQRRVSYCGGAGNEGSGLYNYHHHGNNNNNNACPLLSPFLLSNSNNNNNNSNNNAGGQCRRDAMHHDSPSWWSLGRPTCLAPVDTHSGLTPHTERRTGQSTQQPQDNNNNSNNNSSGGSEDVGHALQPRAQNVCYSRLPGTKTKMKTMVVSGRHDENSDEEATEQQEDDDDVTQAQAQQQPYSSIRAMALPCGLGRLHTASSEEGSVSPGEQDSSLVRLSCLGPPTQRVVRYGEHGVREGGFAGVGRELFAHNEPELFAGPVAAGEAMCPEDSNSVPFMSTTHTTRRGSNTPSSSAGALDGAPRKAYPAMSRRETTLRVRREELHNTCTSRSPEARGETACEDTNSGGGGGVYSLYAGIAQMQPGMSAALHEAQQASWARALRHESDWLPPPSYAGAATIGRSGGQCMGCTRTDSFADDAGTAALHPLADFATLGARPFTVMYNNGHTTMNTYEREALGPHTPRAAMHPRRVFRPCCSLDSPSRATTNNTNIDNNNNNNYDTVGDETQSSMEIDAQMAQLAVQASPTQKRLAFDDVESDDEDDDDNDSHTSGSEADRHSRASSSGYGGCLRRGGPHRLPRSRTAEYGSVDQWLARTQPMLPHTCSSTSATRRSTLLLGPLGFAGDENDEAEASERTSRDNDDEGEGEGRRRRLRRHRLASPTLREPSWLQPSSSSSFSASSSMIASRMQSRRALRHAGVGTNAAQSMRSGHTSTMAMLRRGRMHGSVPAGRKRGHSKARSFTGGPLSGLEMLCSRTRFLQETHAEGGAMARTQCARHVGSTCKEATPSSSAPKASAATSAALYISGVCVQEDAEPDTVAEGHYKRFRLERKGGQPS